MDEQTQSPRRLMVCLGDRIGKSGRKMQAWMDVTPEHTLTDPDSSWISWGNGKPVKGARAGGIFEFQGSPDGKWYVYTTNATAPRFVTMFPDKERALQWQIEHKAAGIQIDTQRLAKRLQDEDQLLVQLDPLRQLYRSLSFAQKRALLVLILEYMQK